jgi:hypothetical protein
VAVSWAFTMASSSRVCAEALPSSAGKGAGASRRRSSTISRYEHRLGVERVLSRIGTRARLWQSK